MRQTATSERYKLAFLYMDSKDETSTILFVDDEKNILEVITEYFQYKGYNVIAASNGLEAIRILQETKIDCCVTDINMPEMNGLELAEHIRKKDNTIPVIIMTGYPSLDNIIKTLKNGVVDFLIKPVNLKQMEVCIQSVFRERRLFVENILLKKEIEDKERLERLNRELIYKVKELHNLNKIMNDVSLIGKSADVYQQMADMAIELTYADGSKFYVINETEDRPFEIASAENKTVSSPDQSDGGHTGYDEAIEKLVMEIVSDEIPLLISDNKGSRGIPLDIRSIMIIPLKIQDKVFGVLTAFIKKGDNHFTDKELYYLSFMSQRAAYTIENLALYEHINRGLITTLRSFVKVIEARDPYTEQHSSRVTKLSILIGKKMGCSSEEVDILNIAGLLHDIGKIGIRDNILLKPGRLTDEEFEKIKEHPIIGSNIVEQLVMWEEHRKIIRHHHERYDGEGYPDGLKKDEIPYLARIVSLADAFDAMASDRAYRKKMETEKIIQIITMGTGTQFDPEIVDAFMALYNEGKILTQ